MDRCSRVHKSISFFFFFLLSCPVSFFFWPGRYKGRHVSSGSVVLLVALGVRMAPGSKGLGSNDSEHGEDDQDPLLPLTAQTEDGEGVGSRKREQISEADAGATQLNQIG